MYNTILDNHKMLLWITFSLIFLYLNVDIWVSSQDYSN